jgi:hypothetical protein
VAGAAPGYGVGVGHGHHRVAKLTVIDCAGFTGTGLHLLPTLRHLQLVACAHQLAVRRCLSRLVRAVADGGACPSLALIEVTGVDVDADHDDLWPYADEGPLTAAFRARGWAVDVRATVTRVFPGGGGGGAGGVHKYGDLVWTASRSVAATTGAATGGGSGDYGDDAPVRGRIPPVTPLFGVPHNPFADLGRLPADIASRFHFG